ncbi:MAG: PEP-CTERM sorting domain-containing protein [Pirellulales bacterium]
MQNRLISIVIIVASGGLAFVPNQRPVRAEFLNVQLVQSPVGFTNSRYNYPYGLSGSPQVSYNDTAVPLADILDGSASIFAGFPPPDWHDLITLNWSATSTSIAIDASVRLDFGNREGVAQAAIGLALEQPTTLRITAYHNHGYADQVAGAGLYSTDSSYATLGDPVVGYDAYFQYPFYDFYQQQTIFGSTVVSTVPAGYYLLWAGARGATGIGNSLGAPRTMHFDLQVVPEPSSFLLSLGSGVGVVAVALRRRRAR